MNDTKIGLSERLFWALSSAQWAIWLYRLAHALHERGVPLLPMLIDAFARALTAVEIDHRARIGQRFRLYHGVGTVVGETSIIGDDCTLFHGVTLGVSGFDAPRRIGDRLQPVLGNRVIVFAGAVLIGPISVGDDARIGANAVVAEDVPAGYTAAGNPARLIPPKDGLTI